MNGPVTVMPSDSTQPTPLLQRMFAAPHEFSLVQLTRLLHDFYAPDMSYEDFLHERVRIRPHLSLGFPPRDVVALDALPGKNGTQTFLLTASPLGLYGAASPLPTFYVEDLLDEARADRSAGRDFLDIFNHVFYELFLRGGWFRYHPMRAVQEQHDTSFAGQLLALVGIDMEALPHGIQTPISLTAFTGLLSQFPRSAAGLEAFLAGLFQASCHVLQCVPRKATVPEQQRCRLGQDNHTLGEDTVLGQELDDATGKVGICLQDLDYQRFLCLTDAGQQELLFWLDFYCTEPLETDIHLAMQEGLAEGARLGNALGVTDAPDAPCRWQCLGRDTWLGSESCPTLGEIPTHYPEGTGRALFRGRRRSIVRRPTNGRL